MVEIKDFNHKDLIALTIFFGTCASVSICEKLNELGIEVSEGTIRARLSEMLREGSVRQMNQPHSNAYYLTTSGEDHAVDVTARLTDSQLNIIA
jgi:DNA-binding transcriptional regulator PaaX